MGQYYKIVNLTKKEFFEPVRSGRKLMEWSWVGNHTIALLHNLLQNEWKDDIVVAVGDYFEAKENKGHYEGQLYAVDQDEHFTEVTAKDFKYKLAHTIKAQQKGFYINETKREFIDLSILPKGSDNWKVSPLSLMVACGNGRGGGDYGSVNTFIVGYWAFDKVRIDTTINKEELKTKGYTETIPNFKEDY